MRKKRSLNFYLASKSSLECLDVIGVEKSWHDSIKNKDSVQEIIQKARDQLINAFWEDVGASPRDAPEESEDNALCIPVDGCDIMNSSVEHTSCGTTASNDNVELITCRNYTEPNLHSTNPGMNCQTLYNVQQCVCPVCVKSFPRRSDLTQHMVIHNSISPYVCSYCSLSFKRDSDLRKHMGRCAGEAKDHTVCPLCGKSFNRSSHLKTHLLTHSGDKSYQCNCCDKRFSRGSVFRRHIKTHIDLKFMGAIGELEAWQKTNMFEDSITKTDQQQKHDEVLTSSFSDITNFQDVGYIEDSFDTEDDFVCSMVSLKKHSEPLSESFSTNLNKFNFQSDSADFDTDVRNRMECHAMSATVETHPSDPSRTIKSKELDANTNLVDNPTCQVHNKKYGCDGELLQHMRTHTEHQPCSHGNTTMSSKNVDMGVDLRTGACPYCPKVFAKKCELRGHLQIHKSERSLDCSVCNKSFKTHSDLKKHFRTHSGEKPYMCPHCGKRFKQNSHLHVHLPTHTTEKRFVCSYCNKRFARNGTLKQHLKTHTDVASWTQIQVPVD